MINTLYSDQEGNQLVCTSKKNQLLLTIENPEDHKMFGRILLGFEEATTLYKELSTYLNSSSLTE